MPDWTYPTAFSSWRYGDGGPEHRAIDRVLHSGRYTMGPETEALEAELAAYHGRHHAIAVNSGSSANLVAVAAIFASGKLTNPVGATVPAIAWATTYAPFVQNGVRDFEVVDIDDTWNAIHPDRVGKEFVVGCSILGNPADLVILENKTSGHVQMRRDHLVFIEDNCESIGARTANGHLTGTFGDLSTFSFFYSHQLSAVEGGAILTDDDELARLCRLLRNHGNAGWGAEELEDQYNFTAFGYNLRPLEQNMAVAREQLRRLNELVAARRANLEHFLSLIDGLPITPQRTVGQPSPFGLAFTVESKEDRQRLATALCAAGVDCRLPTGGSFTRHPYGAPWRDQPTPNADRIHGCGMFLGNAPYPIRRLIEATVKVMRETL